MRDIKKYPVNLFTDSGWLTDRFNKQFGEELNKELLSYEDSLKYYRDLKNSLDTAFEEGKMEGKMEGEVSKAIEVIKKGHSEGLPIEVLSKLTGVVESEVKRILNKG